jgi:lysophospholipase L1-like esterase
VKTKLLLSFIFFTIICLVIVNLFVIPKNIPSDRNEIENDYQGTIYLATNTPVPIPRYTKPTLTQKSEYTILLLGDSMTDYLRPHSKILIDQLRNTYPEKEFNILNYGFGATNILSVNQRLENSVEYNGEIHPPINNTDFDIIFFESFGYNPLSEYDIEKGLEIQTKELEKIYLSLRKTHPDSIIVFMTTIAPNKKLFAKNSVELSEENRIRWAKERISYIDKHAEFAKKYNIPLLNIYETSIDESGDGDLRYISEGDYIHPSAGGVHFIFQEISKYIIENNLLSN